MHTNLNLYVASLRHLKPVQIWGRIALLARRKMLYRRKGYLSQFVTQPQIDTDTLPPFLTLPLVTEAHAPSQLEDIDAGYFTFINRRLHLGRPVNWFPEEATQLWRYNLHYFEYAAAMGWAFARENNKAAYETFRALVLDWINACPPATPVAWDPYPISLRVSNWLKAYSAMEPALQADIEFAATLRSSIYNQMLFLEQNIEYHLLGNHLIENGRALLLAGLFFQDETARRWRTKGEQILWQELREQFLKDGAHYERSPMYHQIMLGLYQDVADVLEARQEQVPPGLHDLIRSMRTWLAATLHPDGEIALFNDAAFGIAGSPSIFLQGDERTDDGLQSFADSGYFTFRQKERGNYLLLDCGPLGPEYQPGHGHCDTLSYELSVGGQRMIVDSGVESYYGDLDWRLYYRSTRAHNTVVVDGAEQSEIWSRFRVGQRAQPKEVHWEDAGEALAYVTAAHTGYQRLPGAVEHRRWMCWVDRKFWLVCDRITGDGSHQAESLIHLHPRAEILTLPDDHEPESRGRVRVGSAGLTVLPWGSSHTQRYRGETSPIQGWYAPEFGKKEENEVWGFRTEGELPLWFGYILWPETGDTAPNDVTIEFSAEGDTSCEVVVRSADNTYRILCQSSNVIMEKR